MYSSFVELASLQSRASGKENKSEEEIATMVIAHNFLAKPK
jgi:hypothetical protein